MKHRRRVSSDINKYSLTDPAAGVEEVAMTFLKEVCQ
jgi:hypothetical protein